VEVCTVAYVAELLAVVANLALWVRSGGGKSGGEEVRRDIVTQLSIWRRSAVAHPTGRPAAASSASTAASRPARGTLLAVLIAWFALFAMLVMLPIVMLANGAEPAAVLGWMAMVAVAMAVSWWLEGRRQRQWLNRDGKPPVENYPAGAAFRAEHGTAESCAEAEKTVPETAWMRRAKWAAMWRAGNAEAAPASFAEPVPAFVVNELPSADGVYDGRVYTVTDAFADTMAEIDRLDLTREERIEALASALRGAKPASRNKQPVGRGGDGGGPQGGRGRVRGGAEVPRVEGGGPRGYLRGGRQERP
jgi:hypothetical protein